MYILQATAILVTLFIGFQGKVSDNLTIPQLTNFIYFRNSFYIVIAATLIALLLSLFDKIFGAFDDVQSPQTLCLGYDEDSKLNVYYAQQIINLTKSIDSVDKILTGKIKIFNWGLILFIFAILILIAIGFMII